MLVDLVREVIDTLKQTSKDEIRSDREDVEKRIRSSRTVGQLGPSGDPFEILTETLQRQYLGGEDTPTGPSDTQSSKKNERNQKVKRRIEQTLNKAATAENEYTFLTSFLEGIPFVGQAAATVAARGISNAENFERSAISYGRINRYNRGGDALTEGRNVGRALGTGVANYGLTPGEALSTMAGFQSALKRDVSGGAFTNLVGAQRTLGLDAGVISQLLSTSRYDRSINDPSRILAQFDKYLRETGRSIALMPELASTFTNAANQILSTRGEVDTSSLAAVISNISGSTGFQGQRLERLTGAFGQLGRTSNPVTRALLMRSFRETDPNASFVDIQEKLEGGLSEQSRPGLQRFFEIMRERTGGGDALTLALQTALPSLGIKDIRDVVKSGGFAKSLQKAQIAPDRDFGIEGQAFVGPIERSSKQISSALELAGDGIVQVIEELKSKIQGALDNFDGGGGGGDTGPSGDTPPRTESEKMVSKSKYDLETNAYR